MNDFAALAADPVPDEVVVALLDDFSPREPSIAWVRWAWSELAIAGVVPPRLNPQLKRYPDHLIMLASLCRLVDRFAIDELSSSEVPATADLTDLPLGWALDEAQIRRTSGLTLHADDEDDSTSSLSTFAIREQEDDFIRALADSVGGTVLFASLWAIGHSRWDDPDDRFPLDSEQVDAIVNSDLTADKSRMFDFVMSMT